MLKNLLKKLTLYEWRNRDPGAPNRRHLHLPSAYTPMKPPTGWTWPAQPSNGKKTKAARPTRRRPATKYRRNRPARRGRQVETGLTEC